MTSLTKSASNVLAPDLVLNVWAVSSNDVEGHLAASCRNCSEIVVEARGEDLRLQVATAQLVVGNGTRRNALVLGNIPSGNASERSGTTCRRETDNGVFSTVLEQVLAGFGGVLVGADEANVRGAL
jgi:hypothetical protein